MALQLLLYGDVGFGDLAASSVAKAIQGSKGDINVRISSGGGLAFEGLAIYSLLRNSGRRVEIAIDGIAASAASVIAMAGDRVTMDESALMMVHRSSGMSMGNAEDMREMADVLAKLDDAMLAAYSRKTGRPAEMLRSLLDAETWMSAAEAKAQGLIDAIFAGEALAAQVTQAPSWAQLAPEVKARLHGPCQPATVGAGNPKMSPEELQAALAAALAPMIARIEQLEAPKPKAQAESAPEGEEPVVETAPAVEDEAEAEAETLFAEMVAAAADEFIASGKLRPEGREMFVNASSTPAKFKTACAYHRAAPAAVATAPAQLGTVPGSNPKATLSQAQLDYAQRAGIKPENWKGTK